jgi:photosystem II stability/assembly factor-like uncharacterized protein
MKRYLLALAIGAAAALLGALVLPASASALSIANGAWQWQNPLPQGSGYTDGYFLDANQGWLISGGTIYHTTDGGLTLTVQARHNVSFSAITFVGDKHGWAVGYPASTKGTAILYRTVNGGTTWTRVRLPWVGGINDVSFDTTMVGWATMNHAILHTTNGGRHWTLQRRLTGSVKARSVQALSARRSWVAARGTLLGTTNGGATWTRVRIGGATDLSVVHFTNASDGWAGSGASDNTAGALVHTADGGLHWQVQLNGPSVSALSFGDSQNGWAITGSAVYHTTDAGADWVQQTSAPYSTWVFSLTPQSAFVGAGAQDVSVGSTGLSLTSDGGTTWQSSTSAAGDYYGALSALQFVNAQDGWAVGSGGEILATTNGGASWTAQSSNTTENLNGLHFTDAANGWAVGDQGTIVATTDGGTSWTAQSSGTSYQLTGVAFSDAANGWATGQSFTEDGNYSSGLILHTSDGGQDWTTQYASLYDSATDTVGIAFSAVAFADAQHGWAVGETAGSDSSYTTTVIMHTSDGGASWTKQLDYEPPLLSNSGSATLSSVACTDAEHAVAVGYDENNTELWRTTDGGQTWTRVGKKLLAQLGQPQLSDVVFANATHGWAVGSQFGVGSYIIHTTDDGATWTEQLVPNDLGVVPLDALSFVSPTQGWAAGGDGDILMTTSGGNAP